MKIGLTDAPLKSLTGEMLGVRAHIEALTEFICSCNTPMTIAIQGDWGTGKTSVMNIVRDQLLNKHIECVWFNTWQFSQFNMQEDVPAALLLELLDKIGVDESKVKKIALNFFKRGAVIASTILGGKEAGDAAKDALAVNPLDIYAQIRNLREQLEKSIKEKLEQSKSDRIVIFVDDLDRMNPGRAVELLEVIKNFMDIQGCVFVLAVDYGVVSRGAREKYGEDMDDAKGRSFFDKIIQLPYNLPVSQYTIAKYLKNIFDIPDSDLRLYKELAENSVGTNPRALKRLANVMNLLKLLAAKNNRESLEKPEFQRVLFAILCLQMAYEPVYSQIMSSEDVTEFLDKTPEERDEMFRNALARRQGKNEEDEARFKSFIESLLAALPKQEGSEDEVDKNLFMELLSMSGLTAAGGLSLLNVNSVKNTFDPALIGQVSALCEEAGWRFREFFDLLDTLPTFKLKETKIVSALAFGESVEIIFQLNEEGIYIFCYSEQRANAIKKPFYESLKTLAPDLMANVQYFSSRFSFLTFPFVEWIKPVADNGNDASIARLQQLKDVALNKYFQQLLPVMLPIWKANNDALQKLQNFVAKIANMLTTIFTLRDGWEIQIAKKGIGFLDNNDLITVRKNIWNPRYKIALSQDGGGQFMALHQIWDANYRENQVTKALLQRWIDADSMPGENLTGRNERLVFWAYLPDPVRRSWTSGKYFTANFKYELDENKEKLTLEIIENYARRFMAVEKEIDALATRDN